MSNFTRAELSATERAVNRLRRRCHDRIESVFDDQRRSIAELERTARTFQKIADNISNLQARQEKMDMKLNNLNVDLDKLEETLRQLHNDTIALANRLDSSIQETNRILPQAQQAQSELKAEQQAAQAELSNLSEQAQGISSRVSTLTSSLDEQMTAVNNLTELIEQADREHKRMDASLDQGMEALNQVASVLNNLVEQWPEVSKRLNELNVQVIDNQHEIIALTEAALNSPALYALLENMRSYRFKSVEIFKGGLEAFLMDEQGRHVSITSQQVKSKSDALLDAIQVSIDLSGFDTEAETKACDQELKQIMSLDDVVITTRNTESPKRRGGRTPINIHTSETGKESKKERDTR